MSRDVDGDDRHSDGARTIPTTDSALPSAGGSTASPERQTQPRTGGAAVVATDARDVKVVWRDHTVHLRASMRVALQTVGAFRTVAVTDLARHAYHGDRDQMDADVRTLMRQGWLERHTMPGRRGGRAMEVLVLSKEGQAFAATHATLDDQRMHTGLVKPKELAHDAALYPMAQAEGARIGRAGGTVRRVILDAELKGEVASARNRLGIGNEAERTAAVAQALHLNVVGGTVQIPDVRLEYETREGTMARVDLELATEHYKPSQVAAKAQAGFTIYAPASQTGRLSAALDERGIIAEIFSL